LSVERFGGFDAAFIKLKLAAGAAATTPLKLARQMIIRSRK